MDQNKIELETYDTSDNEIDQFVQTNSPTVIKKKEITKSNNQDTNNKPKENFLAKIWNKTIFPDKIKAMKEEKELKRQLQREAKKQALEELKPALVEKYKEQELDKLTGKNKTNFMDKLAKGFGAENKTTTGNTGNVQNNNFQQNTNKIENMMGGQRSGFLNKNPADLIGGQNYISTNKIQNMLGNKKKENYYPEQEANNFKPYSEKQSEFNRKMKELLK